MRAVAARSVQPLTRLPYITEDQDELLDIIDPEHRFYSVLRCLSMRHPDAVDINTLIWAGGFAAQGPVCGPAAFHFWLIQTNIDLPKLGWRIGEHDETYLLVKI